MENPLTADEKRTALTLAREALESAVHARALPALDLSTLSPALQSDAASFVTLTVRGQLRGCIGALEPYQPLAEDVREHAIAAGLHDPRFPPVTVKELKDIRIEISRLTPPVRLEYSDANDLLAKLRPGVDGVILRDGWHQATFLPQVWEKIPARANFLDDLCRKMGAPANTWRKKHLEVFVYQVEKFHE